MHYMTGSCFVCWLKFKCFQHQDIALSKSMHTNSTREQLVFFKVFLQTTQQNTVRILFGFISLEMPLEHMQTMVTQCKMRNAIT